MTKTHKMKQMLGYRIDRAISEAIGKAGELGCLASFEFNGVEVVVAKDSDPSLIYRDWNRARCMYISGPIGPYPAAQLSADELANDARLKANDDERRRARDKTWKAEQAAKEATLAERLTACGPMECRDQAAWDLGVSKNTDPYGAGIYGFAETWARLMQKRIADGAKLPDVADECCSLADNGYGITGFMYGAAVSVLSQTWVHGDDLRRWHNGKYGVAESETGTVNPAILTLSAAE